MSFHIEVVGHNAQYAEWLRELSYNPSLQGSIPLPEYVSRVSQLDELYEKVFPGSEHHNLHDNSDFSAVTGNIDPFNEAVVAMNVELLLRFAGEN